MVLQHGDWSAVVRRDSPRITVCITQVTRHIACKQGRACIHELSARWGSLVGCTSFLGELVTWPDDYVTLSYDVLAVQQR